jgi:two-component system, NarL family, sensor histidine kinase DegS
MNTSLLNKSVKRLLCNYNLWAIITLTGIAIVIYNTWPWGNWQFTDFIFQWMPWLSSLYIMELTNHTIGILFLIPIIYAALVFSWPGAMVIYFISLLVVIPAIGSSWSFNAFAGNMGVLLLPLLLISIASLQIQRLRRDKQHLFEREKERQLYIYKIFEAQEDERRRIAQELHDETIQTLLAIASRTQSLISVNSDHNSEAIKDAEWIRDTILKTTHDMRQISIGLRPSTLDNLGLLAALRLMVERFSSECDINCHINVEGDFHKISQAAEVTIFRVVQEALNNIKRHSRATQAAVLLQFGPKNLKIIIKDNGQGFVPPKEISLSNTGGKLGLIGMSERIHSLGGTLRINSELNQGTALFIEVGYQEPFRAFPL